MKLLPFVLITGCSLFYSVAQAGTDNMRFEYQPMEDVASSCIHKQIRDLPDWEVRCETLYGEVKTFTAHVVVNEHPREDSLGVEVLYWVTAPGETDTSPRKYSSTSALLRLAGKTKLHDFSFSQGIENDGAYLVLGWKRDTVRKDRPKKKAGN